jgi:hypothetical protein
MTCKSRLCRVSYCDGCGELLPDDRDKLIAFLVVKVDRLGREVEHPAQAQESA